LYVGVLVRPIATFRRLSNPLPGQWLFAACVFSLAAAVYQVSQAGAPGRTLSISISLGTSPVAPDDVTVLSPAGVFFRAVALITGQWIAWTIQSGVLLAVATLLGGRARWGGIFRGLAWASAPLAVGYVLAVASTAAFGSPTSLSVIDWIGGPGASLGATGATTADLMPRALVTAGLNVINPFVIWHVVLVGVATAVIAGLGRVRGIAIGVLNAAGSLFVAMLPTWLVLASMAQAGARVIAR
jgi:hypothetical protein